jgi:predicted nuclease of predicted toxin-antitoxin system
VYVVGELLPAGSPDASVVAAALDKNAIVVTTDSDFRKMKRTAQGSAGRLERADRIYLKRCPHNIARRRITELIDTIEAEYVLAKVSDRKFFIQITAESYTVFR